MVRSTPGRKLICKVKSVPRAILSSIVALRRGVGLGDSSAISPHAKQSPVRPRGRFASFHTVFFIHPSPPFTSFVFLTLKTSWARLNLAFRWSERQKKQKCAGGTSRWKTTQRATGIMEPERNTSAARRYVLLDPFKFITPDGKSNGVVRKQRPLGTCTTSFRFNTAICFGLPGNADVTA